MTEKRHLADEEYQDLKYNEKVKKEAERAKKAE